MTSQGTNATAKPLPTTPPSVSPSTANGGTRPHPHPQSQPPAHGRPQPPPHPHPPSSSSPPSTPPATAAPTATTGATTPASSGPGGGPPCRPPPMNPQQQQTKHHSQSSPPVPTGARCSAPPQSQPRPQPKDTGASAAKTPKPSSESQGRGDPPPRALSQSQNPSLQTQSSAQESDGDGSGSASASAPRKFTAPPHYMRVLPVSAAEFPVLKKKSINSASPGAHSATPGNVADKPSDKESKGPSSAGIAQADSEPTPQPVDETSKPPRVADSSVPSEKEKLCQSADDKESPSSANGMTNKDTDTTKTTTTTAFSAETTTQRPVDTDDTSQSTKPISTTSQLTPEPSHKLKPQTENRLACLREIIDWEKKYLVCLKSVREVYLNQKELIVLVPPDSIPKLDCVSEIIKRHDGFLPRLEERIVQWSDSSLIGDLLTELFSRADAYLSYGNTYSTAIKLLEQLSKDPTLNSFFQSCPENPDKILSLKDLLSLPTVHLEHYSRAIKTLLTSTDPFHEDYSKLQGAELLVQAISLHVEDALHEDDNKTVLTQIQSRLNSLVTGVNILAPNRKFLKEGEVFKISANASKAAKARHCFLFSDILIYGEFVGGGGFLLHMMLPLEKVSVVSLPSTKKTPHAFSVSTTHKTLSFATATAEEKQGWMDSIRTTIDDLSKRRLTLSRVTKFDDGSFVPEFPMNPLDSFVAPTWQPDNEASNCTVCSKEFTLMNRRHHCRFCGKVVCAVCAKNKKAVPGTTSQQRICTVCFPKFP
ncbi:protein piccolo [Pelomyxa schiedti]|nr:protein piccolo [Pelomyxa schiedti]